MNKKIIYGLLSVLVLVVAVVVSGKLVKAKPEPQKDNKKQNVTYVKAEQISFTTHQATMDYRGRLTAYDNVSLSSEVSGTLIAGDVHFKAGERFRKGEVLLRIYSADIEASLKSGKSSLLQGLSNILPDLKVDFPDEYEKWTVFFNALDMDTSLPVLPAFNSDKEKVFLAANNILTSYYTLQQQEIKLSRYTIYAPFDGSFKTVSKEIGAVASPSAELASLIRTDKLEVTVPVFPQDLSFIHLGDVVTISNDRGQSQEATVARISNFVEAATQSVNVYLSYLPKGSEALLEGEYLEVVFKGQEVAGFEIPREAVLDDSKVYVLKGSHLELEKADVLRRLEDSYIISLDDSTAMVVTESLSSISESVEYKIR